MRRVLGSHRSFFSRKSNPLKGSRDSAVTHLTRPQGGQLFLGFVGMSFHKGSKRLPVRYLVPMPGMVVRTGAQITGLGSEFKPLMDRIATDVEQFARFAGAKAIEFNRFNYFSTEIIVVGFGHRSGAEGNDLSYSVLTLSATAIYLAGSFSLGWNVLPSD